MISTGVLLVGKRGQAAPRKWGIKKKVAGSTDE
jgi:hypothetical protein